MNPFNGVFLFIAWLMTLCALGGRYLAGDANIAPVVLVVMSLLLTGVVVGADRADRD